MAKQIKHHKIVLKKPDGGVEISPLKSWLRLHPENLPLGMDADSYNTHTLRRALQSSGWSLVEQSDQVLLIKPAEDGDISFADEFIGDTSETESDYEEVEEAAEITFSLERDLQSALRANIEQLEPGLKIIDEGKERQTDAGRIDITAADASGTITIIELKAGTASPEVITQILAYMGAIAEIDKMPVRGILVAGDFHRKVIWAARAIPNLELKKYSIQFTFEAVK